MLMSQLWQRTDGRTECEDRAILKQNSQLSKRCQVPGSYIVQLAIQVRCSSEWDGGSKGGDWLSGLQSILSLVSIYLLDKSCRPPYILLIYLIRFVSKNWKLLSELQLPVVFIDSHHETGEGKEARLYSQICSCLTFTFYCYFSMRKHLENLPYSI